MTVTMTSSGMTKLDSLIHGPCAMNLNLLLTRLATCGLASLSIASAAHAAELTVTRMWQYSHAQSQVPGQKSEIVVHDDRTDTLWVAGVAGVDVLDRATGQLVAHLSVSHLGAVNSVAIHDGLAALAIENLQDRTLPGVVLFVDTRTRRVDGSPVPVGSLPDMLTFTPNGRQVLVANEGTPNPRPTPPGLSADDPVGSVSIIDVGSRHVRTLPITAAIPGYGDLRLFPSSSLRPSQPAFSAYDPEPEYIVVEPSGERAYVVLQEANGLAVLNLREARFERILPLGTKDFALPGNELDPNDRDAVDPATGLPAIVLRSVPVQGLYQPDGMALYRHKGRSYIVMANEGDSRDNGSADGEDERRGSAGSGASRLVPTTGPAELLRLTYSNVESTPSRLVTFGARSFSIRDTDGRIVFDSGSLLDREAVRLKIYDDGRSDNKGVEPEGVALLHIEGRVLAFIGLERTLSAAFAVFDVTDPMDVRYLDMIVSPGDRSVEGITAFRVGSRYYVATANEVSDTTALFEVKLAPATAAGPR